MPKQSPAIAVDFGTDPEFEFEEVQYPNHWSSSNREEELPLHYMSEEKARRRVKAGPATEEYEHIEKEHYAGGQYYDDSGKDVYSKAKPTSARIGSGRLPQPPPPPPTSLVSNVRLTPLAPLTTDHPCRKNLPCKIWNTSLQSSILSYRAGLAFTTSVPRTSLCGTKPTLANSGRTT